MTMPQTFGNLTHRTALVSGGLGGIGRACVEILLAHGANVAVTFVPGVEPADQVDSLLASAPDRISAHPLDLRSTDSIAVCLAGAFERWGRVDILVNNAAVGSATVAAFSDSPAEQDTAMLLINADGTLKMCQAFVDLIDDERPTSPTTSAGIAEGVRGDLAHSRQPQHTAATAHGAGPALAGPLTTKIINISSVGGGISQFPGFRLSDGMSKAAVAHLTRQLAAECVHRPIDVFAVCPGATNTAMFQASTLDPMSLDQRRAFVERLPKGRLIEPVEIAQVVAFLASDHSTALHGAVIDAPMGLGVRPGIMTEHGH